MVWRLVDNHMIMLVGACVTSPPGTQAAVQLWKQVDKQAGKQAVAAPLAPKKRKERKRLS